MFIIFKFFATTLPAKWTTSEGRRNGFELRRRSLRPDNQSDLQSSPGISLPFLAPFRSNQ